MMPEGTEERTTSRFIEKGKSAEYFLRGYASYTSGCPMGDGHPPNRILLEMIAEPRFEGLGAGSMTGVS